MWNGTVWLMPKGRNYGRIHVAADSEREAVMGLFSRFFPSKETRRAREILKKYKRDTRRLDSVVTLAIRIFKCSLGRAEEMAPFVRSRDDDEFQAKMIDITYLFLKTYLVVAYYMAVRPMGVEEAADSLNEIGGIVGECAYRHFFVPEGEDDVDKNADEFVKQFWLAHGIIQQGATGLVPEKSDGSGNEVFTILARDVAALTGETDPRMITTVLVVAMKGLDEIDLCASLDAIARIN
jgi:hypothetical protein